MTASQRSPWWEQKALLAHLHTLLLRHDLVQQVLLDGLPVGVGAEGDLHQKIGRVLVMRAPSAFEYWLWKVHKWPPCWSLARR